MLRPCEAATAASDVRRPHWAAAVRACGLDAAWVRGAPHCRRAGAPKGSERRAVRWVRWEWFDGNGSMGVVRWEWFDGSGSMGAVLRWGQCAHGRVGDERERVREHPDGGLDAHEGEVEREEEEHPARVALGEKPTDERAERSAPAADSAAAARPLVPRGEQRAGRRAE
eukprot:6152519-Prymnesium_polylepis.1